MMFPRCFYVRLKRLCSLREFILIIGTFMCLSIFMTTYLFDSTPSSVHHITFKDKFPWKLQQQQNEQQERNILSKSNLNGNHYSNRSVKWRFDTIEGGSSNNDNPNGDQSTLMKRIIKLLKEIEEASLPNEKTAKLALIRGQKSVISRDFPVYRWALEKNNFAIDTSTWLRSKRRASTLTGQNLTESTDWLILICLAYTDDPGICLEKKDFQKLKPFQRVNRIPGLRNLLWRKDFFCSTMNEARKISSIRKDPVTPLCFVMPTQYQQFIDVADAMGYSVNWLLKPIAIGGRLSGTGPQPLNIFSNEGKAQLREFNSKKAIIQQLISNPLLVFGQPVNLRFYVLVTSIAPLRAYIHNEGLVFHRYEQDKNYKKITNRTWMLSQFWQFISKNFGAEKTKKTIKSINNIILETLLITEAMLVTQYKQQQIESNNINFQPTNEQIVKKCPSCFHLMSFDVILNSSLSPWILEINGQPNMQENNKEESLMSGKVKKFVIDDLINLISSTNFVYNDVAEGLEEIIEDNIGVMGITCHIFHELCLSNDDLNYLLQSRRESLNKGGFVQLYPALGTENVKQLIEELSQMISEIQLGPDSNLMLHRTPDLHPLLMSMERFYYRHIIDEEYGDAVGNTVDHIHQMNNNSFVSLVKNLAQSSSSGCSDEPSTLPYLVSIELIPKLQLTPEFSSFTTQYYADAPYEQLLINVYATAQNCQSEVRLDDKYGPSRSTNYTLGVGINKITFVVVDISHTEPWVINTYTLTIKRLSLSNSALKFSTKSPHQVCSFIQDCDMRVFHLNKCGLSEESSFQDWKSYLYQQSITSICQSGSSSGRWVLPCIKCHDKSSCFWNEIRWDPVDCHYPILNKNTILKCLSNKKLLFIGDSTNRGIMHYFISKINGSLMERDKTHDLKIYPNINSGRTHISFAYYPKFWLPTDQRPSFEKAIYQLLENVHNIENNSNTILIFGGVQWLANQHIRMLYKALSNAKLQGIKLVMKTLGSGFHQPIDGVHFLNLNEHRKLALHNAALTSYAQSLGIEVIDTYNMTIARFKDFLPGKCACHFHTVTEIEDNDLNPMKNTQQNQRYKVEGPINAIYTEILISRICNGFIDQLKR